MVATDNKYLTPPEVAKRYGCKPSKIIAWIRRGELRAVDLSDQPGVGRPRFKIDPLDLAAFENNRIQLPQPAKRRGRVPAGVTQYF